MHTSPYSEKAYAAEVKWTRLGRKPRTFEDEASADGNDAVAPTDGCVKPGMASESCRARSAKRMHGGSTHCSPLLSSASSSNSHPDIAIRY